MRKFYFLKKLHQRKKCTEEATKAGIKVPQVPLDAEDMSSEYSLSDEGSSEEGKLQKQPLSREATHTKFFYQLDQFG